MIKKESWKKKSHPQRPCYCSSPTWLPCTEPFVQSWGSPTHLERNQLPHPGMSRFPVMKWKSLSSAHVKISLLRLRIQEFITKLDVFLLSIILKDILQIQSILKICVLEILNQVGEVNLQIYGLKWGMWTGAILSSCEVPDFSRALTYLSSWQIFL